MRLGVVDDAAEQARLWLLADHVFPAFADYRRDAAKAARTIPIVRVNARGDESTAGSV